MEEKNAECRIAEYGRVMPVEQEMKTKSMRSRLTVHGITPLR